MRVLLDECLASRLRADLPGHMVRTVPQVGWSGMKNGRLLRLISQSADFDVFVTMDKSLPHQQRLKALPFAVIILRAKTNRYEDTHPFMPQVMQCLPDISPGQVVYVSADRLEE